MSDFKKIYLIYLKKVKLSFSIIFSIYIFFIFFTLLNETNKNFIYSWRLLSIFNGFFILQSLLFPFIKNSKTILSTMPIKKINLYPISSFCAYITVLGTYFLTYTFSKIILSEPISLKTFAFAISFATIVFSIKFIMYHTDISNIIKITITYVLFLGFVILSIFFVSFYIIDFNGSLKQNIYYIPYLFFIIAFIFIIYISFRDKSWLELKNKKGNYNQIKNESTKLDNIFFNKSKDSISLNKLIIYVKLSGLNKNIFGFIAFLVFLILLFFYVTYRKNGANFSIFFSSIFFINILESNKSILALLGTPITPKKIYLQTLKIRILIVILSSILFIFIDFITSNQMTLINYLVQFAFLFIYLILFENFYSVYRTNYAIALMPFYFIHSFLMINIKSDLTSLFLIIDLVLLIILVASIIIHSNKINKIHYDIPKEPKEKKFF